MLCRDCLKPETRADEEVLGVWHEGNRKCRDRRLLQSSDSDHGA